MDHIKQGQELSRSLTNVGGAPGDTLTMEAAANTRIRADSSLLVTVIIGDRRSASCSDQGQ
jgi:hypothetical protein